MARFTAAVPLNIKWQGHSFVGQAGTTHRVTDALVEEFVEEVSAGIPGFAWVTQDELTSVATLPIGQTDVTGLTAALAAKYDKTGGIISGNTTVTGTLGVGGAATLSSTLSAGATTTGALVVQGSLSATGAATLPSAIITAGVTASTLRLTATGDVSLSSTDHAIQVGLSSTANLAMDANEIQARNNGAVSTLFLQAEGGRLALGTASVVQQGGTAFPGSPAADDMFYRTDYDLWFFYDGTRWLSTTLFEAPCSAWAAGATYTISLSATQTIVQRLPMNVGIGTDIWLEDVLFTVFVASGGTALGASHKWVATLSKIDTANAATSIATGNLDSGSSNAWRQVTTAIDALLGTAATYPTLRVDWTKTGTPGNLDVSTPTLVTFRVVAT